MCGIIASFSGDKIRELYAKNAKRGTGAISLTLLNPYGVVRVIKHQGNNNLEQFDNYDMTWAVDRLLDEGEYYKIIHVQSPTSTDRTKCHPSDFNDTLLWHNGILKEGTIGALQMMFQTGEKWDTNLLHRGVVESDEPRQFLSSLDGSFACLYHSGYELYAFRNAICPLFYDDEMTFSSVKFDGGKPVPANKFFQVNLFVRQLCDLGIDFTTLNDPYGV